MENRLLFIAAVAWLYVTLRFVILLPGGAVGKVLLAAVLLAAAEQHQVTARWFGTLASVELSRAVLIGLGWAFGTFLLLFVLLVLRDLVGVLAWLLSRGLGRVLLSGSGVAVAMGLLAAGLGAWGTWQGVKLPEVKTVELQLPGWPQAFDGYRVVQLSDLHATPLLPAAWQAGVVARTNALHPDLIVITGDLVDGTPDLRADDVRPLADLSARDGVLAVVGNHEYYSNYRAWLQAFERLGLTVLINSHGLIERNGQHIAVAGQTDSQARAFGLPPPDLQAALAGIDNGVPVILLVHKPGAARDSAAAGVTLQLSGHTHGGQIAGLSLLTRRANNGFLYGSYQVGKMTLYVSKGTGLWGGLMLRLGRASEITQLVLRPAPG